MPTITNALPDEGQNWLFGPGSLWGAITGQSPQFQYGPDERVGGNQGPFDTRLTQTQAQPYIDQLNQLWVNTGGFGGTLTDAQREMFVQQINQGINEGNIDPSVVLATAQGQDLYNRQRAIYDKQEKDLALGQTDARDRLAALEKEFLPIYEGRFNELKGLGRVNSEGVFAPEMGKVRSSWQYGNQVAAQEAAIDKDLQSSRVAMQHGMADRGVSSSGKALSLLGNLELGSREAKGRNFGDVLSGVRGDYQNSADALFGLKSAINDQYRNIDLGDLQSNLIFGQGLRSAQIPDYFGPRATGLDVHGLGKGFELQEQGQMANFLLGLGSLAVSAGGQASESFKGFMPTKG